ncbi:HDIG domain-containing protein [Synechococcus moorigangaii CMS01]|nr:HDIG domain-containing protein [Synechococcus moorigangaii CMS01]
MNFWSNSKLHHGQTPVGTPRKSSHQVSASVLALVAVTSLTSVIGDRFYNQPQLAVDTIAPKTIIAPRDGEFEDTETTEAKRQKIRQGAIPSLRRDPEVTAAIQQDLKTRLDDISRIRTIAGEFPFLDPQILSLPSQSALRQASDEQWETISAIATQLETPPPPPLGTILPADPDLTTPIRELYGYADTATTIDFRAAVTAIMVARKGYQQAIAEAQTTFKSDLFQEHQSFLLRLPESAWEQTRREIRQAGDRILTQGIPPGVSASLLQDTIQVQLTSDDNSRTFALDLLNQVLRPNLIEDPEETKRRSEQAAQAVEPVIVSIESGDVIVRRGEQISQEDFILLDGFGLSDRQINWVGLGSYALLVSGAVAIIVLTAAHYKKHLRRRDWVLLLLLSLSTPTLTLIQFPYSHNLPAIGLLTGSLYHPQIAVAQVTLLSGITGISHENNQWDHLIAATVGGIIAARQSGKLRSREEQATLGLRIGAVQTAISLAWNLISSASADTLWFVLLPEAALFGLSGTIWIILALGLSPYLEKLFELLTPIRLAELSNPNRPLLTKLASETPGTFQHTLFVASLAEAAGRRLGCNVELIRAGTLYHDIGKTHDPEGFIENQHNGPNKHDHLDPYESAEIIRKHVTEGIELAKKHKLPKAIRDFIPEHQGTMQISYFYHRACALAEKEGESPDNVDEKHFRYDGPIPQSRETGIVMLADSCEAALRSLKEATRDQAAIMVNRIFRARWQDGQLAESGIEKNELPLVVEVFVDVWEQYNHKRIAYPQAALEPRHLS